MFIPKAHLGYVAHAMNSLPYPLQLDPVFFPSWHSVMFTTFCIISVISKSVHIFLFVMSRTFSFLSYSKLLPLWCWTLCDFQNYPRNHFWDQYKFHGKFLDFVFWGFQTLRNGIRRMCYWEEFSPPPPPHYWSHGPLSNLPVQQY